MQIKYVVLCYVEHIRKAGRSLREEVEFQVEPTHEQIEEVLDNVAIYATDYETDYTSGAVLPDYAMPKKSKIKSIYAVVEQRFYKEVESSEI
jgi:repressor of nif and glnA expression